MKKVIGLLIAGMVLIANRGACAGEMDSLIDKLVEKKVITADEGKQIMDKNKEESKAESLPKLSIDGVIYADYYYNLTKDAAPSSIDAFELSRVYFTAREQISDRIKIRATIEGAQPANTIYIKYAYGEYSDIFPGSNIRMGVIQTPWISYEENNLWKNRFMAKVMPDNEGELCSADVGVGLSGNAAGKVINYEFTAINGEGYKSPETSKDKDFAVRASVDLSHGFKLHTYEHLGKATPAAVDRNRTIFGLSYDKGDLTAVAYYFAAKDAAVNVSGYSSYVTCKILPRLSLVARYDFFDSNTDISNNSWHRIIAGPVFEVERQVLLSLDVQTKNFESASQGNDQTIIYTHLGITF